MATQCINGAVPSAALLSPASCSPKAQPFLGNAAPFHCSKRHGLVMPRQHVRASSAATSQRSKAPATEKPQKVQLGNSGLSVAPIGIGAWSWGDKFFWNNGSWGDENVVNAKAAFDTSVKAGLDFFDTAEVYGKAQFGSEDSEQLLGRFIRESNSGRVTVATKYAALPWRLGRKSVVSTLKVSLEKLGLEQVDLYQLHWPGLWGNGGYIDGLADAAEQGLVKAVGVSNYKEDRLREAHKQLAARGVQLASNQVHYNLLYRLPEKNGVKAACDELNVALIAYSPLAQGMLSGKYTPENPPQGPRGSSYSSEWLKQTLPLLKRMRLLGKKYGDKSTVQVALNWLLAQGNVVPIPGAKSAAQAEEFAGALGWSLSEDEVEELRQLAERVPAVVGFPTESW